ncbi:thyrotropin-releasing hormone-degrading ectoenzyme-like [Homalodisca vitripennis]|uniref:thyrotropin-releasing hormone-degrading ectoenzyme-like n=1 Tax=Homalodisca vitripennis TaxID=197043 RepID=UPI001EEACD2D|nr:thyrotropin-releasing hormone-degrading ectoenzyme-like [Homalodisca vitripennis]
MAYITIALVAVLLGAQQALAVDGVINKYEPSLTFVDPIPDTLAVKGTVTITFQVATASTSMDLTLYWGSSLRTSQTDTTDSTKPDDRDLGKVMSTGTGAAAVGTATTKFESTTGKLTITATFTTAGSATTFTANTDYQLTITYNTVLRKDMKGLFLQQIKNKDGSTSNLIGTDMLPMYAREVFPYGEVLPTNSIQLKITGPAPSTFIALSSTTLDSIGTSQSATLQLTNPNFYGFAMGSGMTNLKPTTTGYTTVLNFYVRKDDDTTTYQQHVDFLANLYYQAETLVDLVHPLKKLSIVFVPDLPKPTATLGIIYIRDDVYYSDYSSPLSEGRYRSLVVPVLHEYFRQFTHFSAQPKTWEDAWLSQAMATFLKYTLLNSNDSPFDFKTDMDVVARQMALAMDSISVANPLQSSTPATTRSVIEATLMDPLKDLKGAYLLTMADLSFPAGVVLSTIKNFLSAKPLTAVSSSDFFTALSTAVASTSTSTATVNLAAKAFSAWSSYISYPQVTLSTFTSTSLIPVLSLPKTKTDSDGKLASYYVPVTVGSKSEPRSYYLRQGVWITGTAAQSPIPLTIGVGTDWVIANQHSNGYYRTNYTDNSGWKILSDALASGDTTLKGYTHIIDDAFAFSAPSKNYPFNYSVPLTMSVSLLKNKEKLFRNWFPVYNGLSKINDNIWEQTEYTDFKDFMTTYLQNLNTLLESGTLDDFEKTRISSLFYDNFCTFNIGNYRQYAQGNVSDILSGKQPALVPSSSYDSLVCCAAQNSGSLTAQNLWTTITTSTNSHYIKHYNSIALGCLSNYDDIAKLFPSVVKSDASVSPYIYTSLWYLADKQPENLLNSLIALDDKQTATAVYLQQIVGAPALASLVSKMSSKLSKSTNADNLKTLSSNVNLDSVVTTTATSSATDVTDRGTWISTNKKNVASSLTIAKATTGTTTSGATASTLSVLLLLPLYIISVSTMF